VSFHTYSKSIHSPNIIAPYSKENKGKLLYLSFMTVAELYRWSIERHWGEKRIKQLEETIQKYVVLPSDNEMCWQCEFKIKN
jgi:hypothetical protein